MKYTFKNKQNHVELITIGVSYFKSDRFVFKPYWTSGLDSLHSLRYEEGGYISSSFFVPTTFIFHWLKLRFYIVVHKEELSKGQKYINIESSYEYVLKKKNIEEQNFLNKPTNFFK